MNPDKRAHQIERAALREAQKVLRREPATEFNRESVLELRIQSAPGWLRIVLLLIGSGLAALAILIALGSSVVGGVLLGLFGVGLLLTGIFGRKRTVEECVAELGANLGEAIIETILHSLG